MGFPEEKQPPVQLFFAVMASGEEWFVAAERALGEAWGPIAVRDDVYDFDGLTDYYAREFGRGLRKRILAARDLVAPESLVEIKLATNAIERHLAGGGDASRVVNIDPGYLNLSKVVLASTKDHAHRLYMGRGIFEEVTLSYRRREGGFVPFVWTYPDYRMPERLAFFAALRECYASRLKEREE